MKNADMPASPSSILKETTQGHIFKSYAKGLTKRELIAAMAMQGMLGNSELSINTKEAIEIAATLACEYTDALLAELEKK